MKNILKSLLFIAVFVVSGLTTQITFAQESCQIQSSKFDKKSPLNNFKEMSISLTLETSNCSDGVNLRLKTIEGESKYLNTRIDNLPDLIIPDINGIIKIELDTEEGTCYSQNEGLWGYECVTYIEILQNNKVVFSGKDKSEITPDIVKKIRDDFKIDPYNETVQETYKNKLNGLMNNSVLVGNCTGSCGFGDINQADQENWDYINLVKGSLPTNTNSCILKEGDVYFTNFNSNYIDDKTIKLNINTEKCHNIPLSISIIEEDPAWTFGDSAVNIDLPNKETTKSISIIPIEDLVEIPLMANKSKCDNSNPDPDCRLFVQIKYNNKEFSTESHLDEYSENLLWREDKSFLGKGILLAYCDLDAFNNAGACMKGSLTDSVHWKLLKEPKGAKPLLTENDYPEVTLLEQTFKQNNPCYTSNYNGTNKEGYLDGCYEFLAPIPGIEKIQDPNNPNKLIDNPNFKVVKNPDGTVKRAAILNIRDYQLGDYINKLFQIAVAILGVISVVMIVVAGVQYMTVESIYGKSNARSRITSAVGGLILALGIYTILWTINPQLLEVNFGSKLQEVSINSPEDLNDWSPSQLTAGNLPGDYNSRCSTQKKTRGALTNISEKKNKINLTTNIVSIKNTGIIIKSESIKPFYGEVEQSVSGESFKNKLVNLNNNLKEKGIQTRLTEVFGPSSSSHKSLCHYVGTCVDLATQNKKYSKDIIKTIIDEANNLNLFVQFESKNAFSYRDDKNSCHYLQGNWTDHFSVYDK